MTEFRQNRIQSFAFVISVCGAFCFACYFTLSLLTTYPVLSNSEIQLDNRVNPNTAPVESLVRLPNIGIARAEAIIEYREIHQENGNHRLVFEKPGDLQKVKGIGPKIEQNMGQWLEFE